MLRRISAIWLCLLALICLPPACATSGATPFIAVEIPAVQTASFGSNRQRGNIVSIQPYVVASDYQTTWHLYVKLESYFRIASAQGWFNEKTIVILPDSVGSGFWSLHEASEVHNAQTQKDAQRRAAQGRPLAIVGSLLAPARDLSRYALFNGKAEEMLLAYSRIFHRLAMDYGVTVVAGSIVLPEPSVEQNVIKIKQGGRLYNAAFVFAPDGRVLGQPVLEAFPSAERQSYLHAGNIERLPVFATEAGRLGVLLGSDALYPQSYEKLRSQRVEFVVSLCSIPERESWHSAWQGYSGFPAPHEFANDDKGIITNKEAQRKYALIGQLSDSGAKIGVSVFLRGHLWEMQPDGQTLISIDQKYHEGHHIAAATLVNLWLVEAPPEPPLAAPGR